MAAKHVVEYTPIVADSIFLTGSVIKKPWIVCADTEHDTGISAAHDEDDVTVNSLQFNTSICRSEKKIGVAFLNDSSCVLETAV
jgi:hypothetical protein